MASTSGKILTKARTLVSGFDRREDRGSFPVIPLIRIMNYEAVIVRGLGLTRWLSFFLAETVSTWMGVAF